MIRSIDFVNAKLGILWRLVDRVFVTDLDDDDTRVNKHYLVPAGLLFSVVPIALQLLWMTYTVANIGLIAVFVTSVGILASLKTKATPAQALTWWIWGYVAAIILLDWDAAARLNGRVWSGIIVLIDVCLVCKTSSWVNAGILFVSFLWLGLERVEASARFGAFDVLGDPSVSRCDCADPPCSIGVASVFVTFSSSAGFALLDYIFTRGFAIPLRRQLELSHTRGRITASICDHLAKYEISLAECVLNAEGSQLSEDIQASFAQLVSNLKSYKRFLPQSCLVDVAADSPEPSPRAAVSDVESPVKWNLAFRRIRQSRVLGKAIEQMRESRGPAAAAVSDSGFDMSRSRRSSVSSVQSVSSQLRAEPVTLFLPGSEARVRRVSLLCINRSNFLLFATMANPDDLAAWFSERTERLSSQVQEAKGIVDQMFGDHCYASFNAARSCTSHGRNAVQTAYRLCTPEQLESEHVFTSCVVSGAGLCGTFGSDSLVRFMVVGHVTNTLVVVERLSARWGTNVLANDPAHNDASTHWIGRLRGAFMFKKRGTMVPQKVWQTVGPRERDDSPESPSGPQEWMYELCTCDKWDEHNKVVEFILRGLREDAAAAAASVGPVDVDVNSALRELEVSGYSSLLFQLDDLGCVAVGDDGVGQTFPKGTRPFVDSA